MKSDDKLIKKDNIEGRFVIELAQVKCSHGHSAVVVFSAQGRDMPFYCPVCGEEMTYLGNFVSHMGGSIDGAPLVFGSIFEDLSDAPDSDGYPDSQKEPPYLS